MMAFAYRLSNYKVIQFCKGNLVREHEDILMIYPNYMRDNDPKNECSVVVVCQTNDQGGKAHITIAEHANNDYWFIYIVSSDARGNVWEWEYISDGGINPVMGLQSYRINGEQQEIIHHYTTF